MGSRNRAVLLCTLLLAACVTTKVTPEGEAVRVTTNPEAVKGCRFVGDVSASDRMNGGALGQDAAEENTHRRIKNATAAAGGNVAFLQNSDVSVYGASKRAEAYRCEDPR